MLKTNLKKDTTFTFKMAVPHDFDLIQSWLCLPDVAPYWQDDGVTLHDLWKSFKGPSLFEHVIACYNGTPFAYLMTSILNDDANEYRRFIEGDTRTRSFDFLIGDLSYRGKGLSVPLIKQFLKEKCGDAGMVFTDPDVGNARAIHVYKKAGFKKRAHLTFESGPFEDKHHLLLAYRF